MSNIGLLDSDIATTMFVGNFIGIVCARSLHYQFYSWWVLQDSTALPLGFILLRRKGTGVHILMIILSYCLVAHSFQVEIEKPLEFIYSCGKNLFKIISQTSILTCHLHKASIALSPALVGQKLTRFAHWTFWGSRACLAKHQICNFFFT